MVSRSHLVAFLKVVHYVGALLCEHTPQYMNEFLKMDIFFVVATGALVVFVIMLCVALWYMIKILRTISHVADTVEEEAQALKDDFDEARASIKRGGAGFLSSLLALLGFTKKTGKRLLKKRRSS
jgi:uncharacterized membrane protein